MVGNSVRSFILFGALYDPLVPAYSRDNILRFSKIITPPYCFLQNRVL